MPELGPEPAGAPAAAAAAAAAASCSAFSLVAGGTGGGGGLPGWSGPWPRWWHSKHCPGPFFSAWWHGAQNLWAASFRTAAIRPGAPLPWQRAQATEPCWACSKTVLKRRPGISMTPAGPVAAAAGFAPEVAAGATPPG